MKKNQSQVGHRGKTNDTERVQRRIRNREWNRAISIALSTGE